MCPRNVEDQTSPVDGRQMHFTRVTTVRPRLIAHTLSDRNEFTNPHEIHKISCEFDPVLLCKFWELEVAHFRGFSDILGCAATQF